MLLVGTHQRALFCSNHVQCVSSDPHIYHARHRCTWPGQCAFSANTGGQQRVVGCTGPKYILHFRSLLNIPGMHSASGCAAVDRFEQLVKCSVVLLVRQKHSVQYDVATSLSNGASSLKLLFCSCCSLPCSSSVLQQALYGL